MKMEAIHHDVCHDVRITSRTDVMHGHLLSISEVRVQTNITI